MSHLDPEERARLGRKYPIIVVPYDPCWPQLYEQEAQGLRAQFSPHLIRRIEHYGSTAVPGLAAKPVIDILAEITSFDAAKCEIVPALEQQGYVFNWHLAGHMILCKGYEPETSQKYHLHMAPAGHPLHDGLLFRDYLRTHPDTASSYEELKYHLAALHRHDREAYTDAKTEVVKEITEKARDERRE